MIKKYNDFIQPINESRVKTFGFPNEVNNELSKNDIKSLKEVKYGGKGKKLLSQKIINIVNNKESIVIENKKNNEYLILIPKSQGFTIYYYNGIRILPPQTLKTSPVNQDITLLFSRMYEKEIVQIPTHTSFINQFNPKYDQLNVYATKDVKNIETFDYVQVKIDKNVADKVNRLTKGMGFDIRSNLRAKISFLADPLKWKNNPLDPNTLLTVQNKVSSIILLDYLAEIKDNFVPSSSGFLFESFIAGLIGGHVVEDNTQVDIYLPGKGPYKSKNYQLKLYDRGSMSNLNVIKNNTTSLQKVINGMPISQQNFILIGLKIDENIEMYLVPFNEEFEQLMEDEGFLPNQPKLTPTFLRSFKTKKAFSSNITDNFQERGIEYLGTLRFGNFTNKINSVKKDLGDSLKDVWESVKALHDEIDTLVTGISAKKRKISDKTRVLKQSKKVDSKVKKLYKTIITTEEE